MVTPETEVVECDILICGGGMAGCGAAHEAAYWAKAKGLRVVMVEKAAVEAKGFKGVGLEVCYVLRFHWVVITDRDCDVAWW